VTNFRNTVESFKVLVGRQYKDADVQEHLANVFYRHQELPDGTVGIVVSQDGEDTVLRPKQVMASLLGHLRDCSQAHWRRR